MKKISLIFILILMSFTAFIVLAQDGAKNEPAKKENLDGIKKAYAYVDEMLLISETDMNCTYIISKKIAEDLLITGADDQNIKRKEYSDQARMYISKGSNVGINEGDMFLVLAKGGKVDNALTHKKLGTYYLKISLAEVTCIYEDKAVITLKKGCNPVHIGDILIPFKPGKTVFKRKLDYRKCRLPESDLEARAVYSNVFMEHDREISGPAEFITIDRGRESTSKGDFVLFYRRIKKNLPDIIVGSGIVINAQHNNSTVKILEATAPIEMGTHLIIIPSPDSPERNGANRKGEDIPLINKTKMDGTQSRAGTGTGTETFDIDILFNINEKSIDAKYMKEFDKLKSFISSKNAYSVVLRGYACSIGGLEHNLELSKSRVENIKAYLVKELGIPGDRIESLFYGEKSTPFDNSSEEDRRKNRRVNIQVSGE
ncbi:MAG: OmpA family protein [bacterium]|nr:OmpA family protein [bacterium]